MQARKDDIKTLDRLKKRSDFLRVQKDGAKWVSKSVIVQAAAAVDGNARRYGITVTKHVSKSAVERNRIKRRLRAACADVLPGVLKHGTDIVLIGRAETARCDYDVLMRDLTWCLKKLTVTQ